ncbi:hypothetical protein GTQ40_17585 [Flavobacteriaceae bacterium R38]|nr:hypothetical protein [Flavobacteriaceae bacterium R38]
MYRYFINFFLFLFCALSLAQETPADTIVYKEKYGLRLGADLSRLARSFLDDDYERGFEVVADLRVSDRFFIAAEFGNEENTVDEDFFNFTSEGSYIKIGFDYNVYQNWLGSQNSIHIGLRYAASTFSQTVNSFTINNRNQFFNEGNTPGTNQDILREFDGLNLQWVEGVVGVKAEVLSNLYLGISLRIGVRVSETASDVFPNLWSPGFNRITDDSSVGVGYNYTLSYSIPIYKKRKK